MTHPALPSRHGPRPRTTPWAPHIQQDQNAPPEMQAALAARVFALPDEHFVMLYGPRDESEVDVIFGLILAAYRFAGGRGIPEESQPTVLPRSLSFDEAIGL